MKTFSAVSRAGGLSTVVGLATGAEATGDTSAAGAAEPIATHSCRFVYGFGLYRTLASIRS